MRASGRVSMTGKQRREGVKSDIFSEGQKLANTFLKAFSEHFFCQSPAQWCKGPSGLLPTTFYTCIGLLRKYSESCFRQSFFTIKSQNKASVQISHSIFSPIFLISYRMYATAFSTFISVLIFAKSSPSLSQL